MRIKFELSFTRNNDNTYRLSPNFIDTWDYTDVINKKRFSREGIWYQDSKYRIYYIDTDELDTKGCGTDLIRIYLPRAINIYRNNKISHILDEG